MSKQYLAGLFCFFSLIFLQWLLCSFQSANPSRLMCKFECGFILHLQLLFILLIVVDLIATHPAEKKLICNSSLYIATIYFLSVCTAQTFRGSSLIFDDENQL